MTAPDTDTSTPKRRHSPELIANPFIKKRNLGWTLQSPGSATHDDETKTGSAPTTAAIESGEASTEDHLVLFTTALRAHIRKPDSDSPPVPLLPLPAFEELYRANAGSRDGAHFVIHQHDHPVAGTHYDLRLQINESSSASWAIMYGLPGDPNSARLNRNATETRVHCLWNHLIETASRETGSLLIWDTGTYSVLPRRSKHAPRPDPSSPSTSQDSMGDHDSPTQQQLLQAAFQDRKIRLRLHGSRLPDPYILYLRLTKTEDASGRARSERSLASAPRRRRRAGGRAGARGGGGRGWGSGQSRASSTDRSDREGYDSSEEEEEDSIVPRREVNTDETVSAVQREIRELEDEHVRRTNAYVGATNTIGSVHQRRWYLSIDRSACGFVRDKHRWVMPSDEGDGNEATDETHRRPSGTTPRQRSTWPFHVRGVDHERSVVTARRGQDVLDDEGVTGFVARKGWRPVLH